MRKLWLLMQLYCRPSQFVKACVRETSDGTHASAAVATESRRTASLRRSHAKAFILVFAASFAGWLLARYINDHVAITAFSISCWRLTTVVVVAWSVLSKVGWEIQSWGGESLLEQVNNFAFRFFYLVGLFMTTTSLFLEPAASNA